jgi:hypothetical protein
LIFAGLKTVKIVLMKNSTLFLLLLLPYALLAQVGIGTNTPEASAKLEVNATNKGFLPPRVALTGTTDTSTISSPASGLLIYNTATAGSSPTNVIPGYYFYNGTSWSKLNSATDNAANVTGTVAVANGGTGTTTGSISGTTALTFAAGGTNQNVTLTPSGTGKTILNGNVGIGTSTPSTSLEVGNAAGTSSGEIVINPQTNSSEGGQITIKKSVSGSGTDWVIDQYSNNSTPRFRIFTGADETKGFAINELGNVGIGVTTQNQGEKLYVNGAVKVNGNLNANGGYYMVAGLATSQTITNTGITIPMTDKDDPNNWWDASNYRFQPTVAGYYFVSASVHFAFTTTSANGIQCNMQILKNGAVQAINQILAEQPVVYLNLTRTQTATTLVYMNGTTDYISLTGYTNNALSAVTITGDGDRVWTKMEAFKLN